MSKRDRNTTDRLLLRYERTLKRVKVLGPGRAVHTWRLDMDGQEYYAVSLVRSSEYWYHRLQLTAPHITMVVCLEHDTVLPLPCLALLEGWSYGTHQEPRNFTARTRYTSMVVTGALLCGLDEWFHGLQDLPTATRYRYLARMHEYTHKRPGRPLEA